MERPFSDLQSCAARFPWSPLIWLVPGGICGGLGYFIGDTFFAVDAANTTISNALLAYANATGRQFHI